MDDTKKAFIDRFVQSVLHHGPSLITLTRDEQGDGQGSVTEFLHPSAENSSALNYFKNRLHVSTPMDEKSKLLEVVSETQQKSEYKGIHCISDSEQEMKRQTCCSPLKERGN